MFSTEEKYIVFALKKYKRINLSGIGMLELLDKKVEAHPISHEFKPPTIQIVFSHGIFNGKNIEETLSKDASIDILKAKEVINKYFAYFLETLASKKKYSLSGIGNFVYDSQKSIVFKAEPSPAFTKEHYGLFELAAGIPKKEKTPTPITSKKKKKRKIKAFPIIILLIAAIIVAGIFVFPKQSQDLWNKTISIFDKNDNNSESTRQEDTDNINDSTANQQNEDSINKDNNIDIDTTIIQENEIITDSIIPEQEINSGPKYYIVSACFISKELANRHVNKLKAGSYPTCICKTRSDGSTIVAFDKGYSNKEDALKHLNTIQIKENRNDLWLYYK